MPLATANETVHALLPTHVQRTETSAHDCSHRAIRRAAVNEQAAADHDDVHQDRVAHQFGFAYCADVSRDEPQADVHDQSPSEHGVLLASSTCCTTTVNAPIA